MENNFRNIYFTALDKQVAIGEVVTNQDIKECLDYAVNTEFWNMSEGFQASLSGLLFKEYRLYNEQKEQLKQDRLKNLEKARLVKALKKAERVKAEQEATKSNIVEVEEVEAVEESEAVEVANELVKELDKAIEIIKGTQKRKRKSLNKDGLKEDELVNVNGKTYRLVEQ